VLSHVGAILLQNVLKGQVKPALFLLLITKVAYCCHRSQISI